MSLEIVIVDQIRRCIDRGHTEEAAIQFAMRIFKVDRTTAKKAWDNRDTTADMPDYSGHILFVVICLFAVLAWCVAVLS